MQSADLAWALSELNPSSDRQRRYSMYRAYYMGDHRLAFATRTYRSSFWEIFREFADNLCSSVVDIQAERLEILGFTTSEATTEDTGKFVRMADPTGDAIWDIWEGGYLPIASDQVHHDVLCFGDAFGIVWDEGDGVCFYHQEPEAMAVRYSKTLRGTLEVGAKYWADAAGFANVALYYDDEVQIWRSLSEMSDPSKIAQEGFGMASVTPTGAADYEMVGLIPHNLGFVPVYHFANKRFGRYGISELRDVIPLQNALNKQICDMLVAMEFQAFRQRWMTGVEIELDDEGKPTQMPFDYGADRFLALPDAEAKVGDFAQADLTPFYMAIRDSRAEVARVAGVPLHYFYVNNSDAPSGEALKTSELRFSRKLRNRQRLFGKTWENAMEGLLEYDDKMLNDADGITVPDGDFDINVVWEPTDAYSPSERADFLLKKKALGVPFSQLQKEMGYDHQEIERFADAEDAIKATTVPVANPSKAEEASGAPTLLP